MPRVALLALFLLAGCSDSTSPNDRALPAGTYTYTNSDGLSGTLTITFASSDSLAGTWDVRDGQQRPAFRPEVVSIGWNFDAFVVFAQPAQLRFATHSHRLARSGDNVSCSGNQVLRGAFTCTLTRR
jgi:hypothetical protein